MSLSKPRVSKPKCNFRSSWLLQKDPSGYLRSEWLKKHNGENAFCTVCQCTVKFSTLGGQAITHHAKSDKHISQCRVLLNRSQLHLERGRPVEASTESPPSTSANNIAPTNRPAPVLAPVQLYSVRRNSVRAEIFWSLKCVASDYPAASCDGLKDLFGMMFEGSPQLEDFSLGRTKFIYLLTYGLAPYFRDELKDDLCGSYYSLYFDETTNDGGSKELRTGVRYWSQRDQRVVSAYLQTSFIGKATGETIAESIVSVLDNYSLPLNKLLMLGRDGPTVNVKVQRLINERVKEVRDKPLLDIGSCNIHIGHNAFCKGLEKFGETMSEFVIYVYDFFDGWPSRWEDYENVQDELEISKHRFIKHVASRWLTLGPAIDRILEQWPALEKFFVDFIPKERPQFTDKAGCLKIKKNLLAKSTRATLVFVRDSASIFTAFTGTFQSQQPLIHLLHDELRTVALTLINKFCKPVVIKRKGVCLSALKPENLPMDSVDVGENVNVELQRAELSEKDILVFRKNVGEHFVAATRHLLEKSALKAGSNVRYYRCLQPQERRSTRSCSDIVTLAKNLPVQVDYTKVADEWKLLQFEKDQPGSDEESIDIYWTQFKMKRPTGNDSKYPTVTAVVKVALSLSHGQGDVERGFSESGRTLTPDRASMSERTLDAYMVVKKALRRFHNKPHLVPVTNQLIISAEGAHAKYCAYLEDEKKKKEKEQEDNEEEQGKREQEEAQRKEALRKCQKRILEDEEKLKNEESEEVKKRKSGLKLLDEGTERLKTALQRNDFEEIYVAHLMIEMARKAQTEAEAKRKEVNELKKTIDKKRSQLFSDLTKK